MSHCLQVIKCVLFLLYSVFYFFKSVFYFYYTLKALSDAKKSKMFENVFSIQSLRMCAQQKYMFLFFLVYFISTLS